MDELIKCQSLTEAAKFVLGVEYYNGAIAKLLIKKCFEKYDIDIVEVVKQNKLKKKKHCISCGKELKNSQKKFCSSSCAATYNNKHRGNHSDETKKKISESVKKYIDSNPRRNKNGEETKALYEKVCQTCGKTFFSKHKNVKFCSHKCVCNNEEVKEKLRNKQKQRIKNGTFKGWQKRNITSYPEKFFMKVLDNNNIKYIREDFSTKKYFLDFLICLSNGIKIDLEIDGKQHEQLERKSKDLIRDEYLTKNGFIVYRIKWNKITNDNGKNEMKEKINKFLEFYNKCNN